MIKSERLNFFDKLYQDKWVADLVGFLQDKENVRFSEQRHRFHSLQSQYKYCSSFHDPNKIFYVCKQDPQDTLVGSVTAFIDRNNGIADIGILIGRPFWGNGYGCEAWSAVMQYLFQSGIRKIEAGCMESNNSMLRVFQKSGMHEEGRREDHFVFENRHVAMLYYGKFK